MQKWVSTKAQGIENQLKSKKNPDRPEGIDSSDEESEDEVDLEVIERSRKKTNQRTSVSAEVYGRWNVKKSYQPKVVPKSIEIKQKIRDRLSKAFMFGALEEKEREIVINAMEERTFKAGDNVIKQGDDGDVLYVVESGTLDCTKLFPGKSEPTYLKTYQPGEIFGELSLLYNCPRAANIIAKQDSLLYTLDRECFNHIVKDAAIKKRERYMDFLQKVNLLETLDDYERSKICDCLQSQKYAPEQYIIREGENGNRFFFIEEGKAVATKKNAAGEEEVVYDYNQNDYFGELALLQDTPRAASIIAKVAFKKNHFNPIDSHDRRMD